MKNEKKNLKQIKTHYSKYKEMKNYLRNHAQYISLFSTHIQDGEMFQHTTICKSLQP